jgi:integrase
MKLEETLSDTSTINSTSKQSSAPFVKVLDGRKQAVRGLWMRNGAYYAQVKLKDAETGESRPVRKRLQVSTLTEAKAELSKIKANAKSGKEAARRRAPLLSQAIANYTGRLEVTGKTRSTIATETAYLNTWLKALGGLQVSRLKSFDVRKVLDTYAKDHAPRSVNLLLVSLRNVLKDCVQDGFLSALPHDVDGLSWRKTDRLERSLLAPSQIDSVCQAALKEGALKNGSAMLNGAQFVDYIRFLQFSGAREKEALKVEWSHVNFDLQILTIGAEGGTKNRKPRRIDLNADLLALLKDMYSRRDESKAWLFPSARFGARDEAAKTFRETLKLACKSAEVEFGFHDLRHYFISHAVMAGVDYLTIARWVGHQDGGVLIGKVYGHLNDSHTRRMATKLSLSAPEPVSRIA